MSRSCSQVTSPAPARSTLITSAPNQASSWVQVGPDCTCVKSRIRTPSNALPILLHRALYLYIVWFLVPGAYSRGSTQMLMTADRRSRCTDSRARCSAVSRKTQNSSRPGKRPAAQEIPEVAALPPVLGEQHGNVGNLLGDVPF